MLAWQGSLLLARVTPDGRWVASGNQDASVHVWRLWSGEDAEMAGYPEKVDTQAFDCTSRWMANGGTTEVHLWDFSGKGPMGRSPRTLPGHDAQLSALAWQPTGDLLASAGREGGVAVWSPGAPGPARGRARIRTDAGVRVTGLAWSRDGVADRRLRFSFSRRRRRRLGVVGPVVGTRRRLVRRLFGLRFPRTGAALAVGRRRVDALIIHPSTNRLRRAASL